MDDIDTKKLVLLFSLVMVLTLRMLVVVVVNATEISDNENFLGSDYNISTSVTDIDTIQHSKQKIHINLDYLNQLHRL